MGHPGPVRLSLSRTGAARSKCNCRLEGHALHVRPQLWRRPVVRIGPGVGRRASHRGQRAERRRRAGARSGPLDSAQRAGRLADRHVAGVTVRHRPVSAQPSKCVRHGHRLPVARSADDVSRSACTRVHSRTHRAVPRRVARARGGSAGRHVRGVYRCSAALARWPARRVSR